MSTHNHPILKKCTCEDCRVERGEITELHPPLADIKDICQFVEIEVVHYNNWASDEEVKAWLGVISRVRTWLDKVNPPTER